MNNLAISTAPSLCAACGVEVFTLGGHQCGNVVSSDLAEVISFLLAERERHAQRRRIIGERAVRLRHQSA